MAKRKWDGNKQVVTQTGVKTVVSKTLANQVGKKPVEKKKEKKEKPAPKKEIDFSRPLITKDGRKAVYMPYAEKLDKTIIGSTNGGYDRFVAVSQPRANAPTIEKYNKYGEHISDSLMNLSNTSLSGVYYTTCNTEDRGDNVAFSLNEYAFHDIESLLRYNRIGSAASLKSKIKYGDTIIEIIIREVPISEIKFPKLTPRG